MVPSIFWHGLTKRFDGTGFPHNKRHENLSFLSKVFIISEELVMFVLKSVDKPDSNAIINAVNRFLEGSYWKSIPQTGSLKDICSIVGELVSKK